MPDSLVPLCLLGPVLVATILSDLRRMRIPNSYGLTALALFAVTALVWPPADLMARLLVALVVFALGFIGFAFRLIGGGDVKMLAVLMLFVPVPTALLFANLLSASLLAGILFILGLRRLPVTGGGGWTGIWGSARFPMGLSIGLAGLIHPWLVLSLLPH